MGGLINGDACFTTVIGEGVGEVGGLAFLREELFFKKLFDCVGHLKGIEGGERGGELGGGEIGGVRWSEVVPGWWLRERTGGGLWFSRGVFWRVSFGFSCVGPFCFFGAESENGHHTINRVGELEMRGFGPANRGDGGELIDRLEVQAGVREMVLAPTQR